MENPTKEDIRTVLDLLVDGDNSAKHKISEASVDGIRKISAANAGPVTIYGHMNAIHGYVEVSMPDKTMKGMLWTDSSDTQPFNRHGIYYNGMRFSSMKLVSEHPAGNDFTYSGYGSWRVVSDGPVYHNYLLGTVEFRIHVGEDALQGVMAELMSLLGKEWIHPIP